MFFSEADWLAIRLTAELATLTTLCLMGVGTPIAWWLAHTRSRWKPVWSALIALPLVLPPTVLGFYLLLLMGPQGPLGWATRALGTTPLPFSFQGLLLASVLYSLPFVVQPMQRSFEAVPPRLMEAAATLRAHPWDRFFTVAIPMAQPGIITAAVLGFAHTVGEFGVVLMIGGNLPGQTRVLSVALYDHVESTEFDDAHRLAAAMVVFAWAVLTLLYRVERWQRDGGRHGVPV